MLIRDNNFFLKFELAIIHRNIGYFQKLQIISLEKNEINFLYQNKETECHIKVHDIV